MYVQVYVSPERLFGAYMLALAVFLVAVLPLTTTFSLSGTAAAQVVFSLALIYFCHSALRSVSHEA
jgi:hypothetical protein